MFLHVAFADVRDHVVLGVVAPVLRHRRLDRVLDPDQPLVKAAPSAPRGGARRRALRCRARPARARLAPGSNRRSNDAGPGHNWCHASSLPRLPLSSSRTPRLGRPPGVASRWLCQPRPGTRSQGPSAYQEDGGRAGSLRTLSPCPGHRAANQRGSLQNTSPRAASPSAYCRPSCHRCTSRS